MVYYLNIKRKQNFLSNNTDSYHVQHLYYCYLHVLTIQVCITMQIGFIDEREQ